MHGANVRAQDTVYRGIANAIEWSPSVTDQNAVMAEERKDKWAAGKLYKPYVGRWSRRGAAGADSRDASNRE